MTLGEVEENLLEPIDDLRDVLEGLVQMNKIERTGKIYHAVGVKVEKKTRSASSDEIDFPDWVETKKDQVDYLISEEASLLKWTKTITWWDDIISATGKEIYDALHSNSIKHEYVIYPNESTKRNEVRQHESVSSFKGITFRITEGVYSAIWFNVKGYKIEKEFRTYEELRKWILQNL